MPRLLLSDNPYGELDLEVAIIDRPRRLGGARSSTEQRVITPSQQLALPGSQLLAPSSARGGPDNSDLTERGVRGLFYEQLEIGVRAIWAIQAGLMFASDTLTEKHRWLGAVPEPRKHFGGLNINALRNKGIDVTNEDYETSIGISKHDWRRDKTGHLGRRSPELAMAYLDHWNKLCVDVCESNDTAYDGVAFFSDSHSDGSSGTIDNNLTTANLGALNVSDTTAPTKAEALAILSGMAAKFFGFKDDQGRPANQGARTFLLLVHPDIAPNFVAAARDMLTVTGGTNPLSNLGWTFLVVPEARLSSSTVLYMFRVDDRSSPAFILQEEDSPSVEILGEGSDHFVKNNETIVTAKACRAAAPGDFRKAIKGTIA